MKIQNFSSRLLLLQNFFLASHLAERYLSPSLVDYNMLCVGGNLASFLWVYFNDFASGIKDYLRAYHRRQLYIAFRVSTAVCHVHVVSKLTGVFQGGE